MSRAETCVTLTPGMVRSSSAMFWVGAFSIVAAVITLTVAGALISVSSVRDGLTMIVSSYLAGLSVGAGGCWVDAGCEGDAGGCACCCGCTAIGCGGGGGAARG